MSSGDGSGATYVLVPGAWCNATIWDSVAQRLRANGCHVSALTLTGLEPSTRAQPSEVGLQHHVGDVLRHLTERDLREVILVGHSNSGLVVGQVADRIPERVARTVFVQAFLPVHGRSLPRTTPWPPPGAVVGDDVGNHVERQAARSAEARTLRSFHGERPPRGCARR